MQTAVQLSVKGKKTKCQSRMLGDGNTVLARLLLGHAKETVDKTTRGKYPAAYEILNCVENASGSRLRTPLPSRPTPS